MPALRLLNAYSCNLSYVSPKGNVYNRIACHVAAAGSFLELIFAEQVAMRVESAPQVCTASSWRPSGQRQL